MTPRPRASAKFMPSDSLPPMTERRRPPFAGRDGLRVLDEHVVDAGCCFGFAEDGLDVK